MEIIFCKTRADPEFYRSYTDFWRLVELAGFEVVWLDELEPGRDAVYVVTPRNGELPGVLPRLQGDRRCKFVWWCLERPDTLGSVTRGKAIEENIDELWLSDRWLASLHHQRGWGPVRFVPVGSHEGLGDFGWVDGRPSTKELPMPLRWAHMSYIVPRRKAIYDRIRCGPVANCWGDERDIVLKASWAMVNVHQDEWPVIEPLRFALAAAWGLMIFSETVADAFPYRDRIDARFVMREWLPSDVNMFPMTPRSRVHWAQTRFDCWQRMTQEFEFGKCVKEAVSCLK